MRTERETAKNQMYEKYEDCYNCYIFMLTQEKKFIAKAWLVETVEHVKLINFIQKKGLYADYLKFQCII